MWESNLCGVGLCARIQNSVSGKSKQEINKKCKSLLWTSLFCMVKYIIVYSLSCLILVQVK